MKKALAALAILCSSACALRQAAAPTAPDVVGTWRLVEFWDRDAPDQPQRFPFGEHPLGYFVYDASGNVFIQIARNPQPARLSPEDLRKATQEELRSTLEGYVAYFGTYTIDSGKGVIVHHVTADVRREYTGTDQKRPFRLSGGELLIGDGKTWLRRLVRVR